MFGLGKDENKTDGVEMTPGDNPTTGVEGPAGEEMVNPVNTQEEINNEEAAEKKAEDSSDNAANLAEEDVEVIDPLAEHRSFNELDDQDLKDLKAFGELFPGKNPIRVIIELSAKVEELYKKVF